MVDTISPPLVDPIPIPVDAPKRGRGRPPKTDPVTGERINPSRKPPKLSRPRRPTTTPKRSRGPRSLRPEIAAFLTLANSLVLMSPIGTRPMEAVTNPGVAPTRIGDELDAYEISALASAIDAQCTRSPRFRKYVERALTAGSGGQLVTVLGIIATRRAARHGIAPASLDPMLGMMLAGGNLDALASMPTPTPEPDATPDVDTGEIAPRPLDERDFDFEKDG